MLSRGVCFEAVAQAAEVVLTHERLEYRGPRQDAEALAETRLAAEPGELRLVGEAPRMQLVHAEEVPELGMLAVEDRPRLADRVLPPGEGVDAHRVVVAGDGVRVVADLQ